jgi:putative ABC transport system permease protein
MLALITANVRRRSARTLLTAAGIAVGVAAVVALLALSAGLNRAAAQFANLGGADFGVFQADAGDPTSSVLPLSLADRIKAQRGISEVAPIQLLVSAIHGAPGAIVLGVQRNGFARRQLVITGGTGALDHGTVLVGSQLAEQLGLRPESALKVSGHRFRVGGIYHTGLAYENAGAVMSLPDAQALAGRSPDEVTTIAVRVTPQTPIATAKKELAKSVPGVTIISDPGEASRAGANTVLISKAVLFMIVLALIIGGLAVANTMLAAVLERRRELALLATIGWSSRQLGSLVLGEALVVSMIGTGIGLLLGLAASKLLPGALGLGAFITPVLTAWGLGRAVLIGTVIGTVGSLYPIWRVTRMRASALVLS